MNPGDLQTQNQMLEERLAQLTKMSKKMVKPKKDFYLNPVKKRDIVRYKNNYKEIASKMDYDAIKDHNQNKAKLMAKKKREKELESCTFKPKITKKTKRILRNMNYVKPQNKKLARKKKEEAKSDSENSGSETYTKIMEEIDRVELEGNGNKTNDSNHYNNNGVTKRPKKIKKINEEFYEKQLLWMNKNKQMAEKQRLENAMKEYSEIKQVPKTNKRKNKKMLGQRKKFIDRVDDQTMKIKLKKDKLGKNVNRNNFTPKINRNYKVKSKVNTYNSKSARSKRSKEVEEQEEYEDYYEEEEDYQDELV